jgi:hypothetical protein
MKQSTDRLAHPRLNLIEERLGENLAAFVDGRRPGVSWRLIAQELIERTGVDITGQAVRAWHGQLERAA